MTFLRSPLLRVAMVAFVTMLVWKTLFTHAEIPHKQEVSSFSAGEFSLRGSDPVESFSSQAGPVKCSPEPGYLIPHHLEDLRVFRKALVSVNPVDCSTRLPDAGVGGAFPVIKIDHTYAAKRPLTEPPFRAHATVRSQLQVWRI